MVVPVRSVRMSISMSPTTVAAIGGSSLMEARDEPGMREVLADRMLSGSKAIDGRFLEWISGTSWNTGPGSHAWCESYSIAHINRRSVLGGSPSGGMLTLITFNDCSDGSRDMSRLRQIMFSSHRDIPWLKMLAPVHDDVPKGFSYLDDPITGIRFVSRPSMLEFDEAIVLAASAPGGGPGTVMIIVDEVAETAKITRDGRWVRTWVPFTVLTCDLTSCRILDETGSIIDIDREVVVIDRPWM